MRTALLFALAGFLSYAQNAPKLEFDVASIKTSAPQPMGRNMIMMNGGPGTADPGHMTFTNITLRMLLTDAFDIKSFQLTAPGTVDDLHFDVLMKVPPGATKEDSRVMLQNLLIDRFGLKVHRETKEMQAFALTAAKGGVKLKPSVEAPTPADGAPAAGAPPPGPPGPPKMDKNGFPTLSGRRGMIAMVLNGRMRLTGGQRTISEICDFLGSQMGRPVVDQTGLTGKYDFNLEFAPDGMGMGGRGGMPPPPRPPGAEPPGAGGDGAAAAGDPAPTLIGALQDQLGLKLEAKKLPVEIVVVDHIEKTPSEN